MHFGIYSYYGIYIVCHAAVYIRANIYDGIPAKIWQTVSELNVDAKHIRNFVNYGAPYELKSRANCI